MGTNIRAAELVEQLLRLVPAEFTTVKLLSGGSEANEAAIKLARQFHKQTGHATKYKVISHYRGYHGGTGNALAASGWAGWKNAFEPMPSGFVHLQTPDPDSPLHPGLSPDSAAEVYCRLLRATVELEGSETIAAIITEPVMMSAGVVVPPDRYMHALREVCDEHNILLVFDEIITGFGRTGTWFAAEHPGVWPDIFCCGKGVTGGYSPLSIVFMTNRVAEPFWGEPGSQFFAGHAYGGNPVACAAGLAAYAPDPRRRIGLDVALEARRRGLLLRAAPWFVCVAPPLVATRDDVDAIVDILRDSLTAVTT